MTTSRWNGIYVGTLALMATILGFLVWSVPRNEEGMAWFDPMIPGGWMAWTFPVALFFFIIACLLNGMTLMSVPPERKFIARGVVLIPDLALEARVNVSESVAPDSALPLRLTGLELPAREAYFKVG